MIEFISFIIIWIIITGALYMCVMAYEKKVKREIELVLKRYNVAKKAGLSHEEMKEIL